MQTTKVRLELTTKKHKSYVQVYVDETDILIHTYIFNKTSDFTITGLYIETEIGGVTDYT